MDLSDPGPELRGTDRGGDTERVILAQHRPKGEPTYLEVGWRRDVDNKDMLDEAGMSHAQMRKVTDKEFERALRGEKL